MLHTKASSQSNYSASCPPCHSTPITPYNASSSQYKANVNRTKTRKWVEAKTQNYDGDDWGAEDDFEEEDDVEDNANDERQDSYTQHPSMAQPPRLGKLTMGLRAIGQGSNPSTPRSGSAGSMASLRPSERIAMEKQAQGQRSVTGPPALQIQTQGVQSQKPVLGAVEQQKPAPLSTDSTSPPRKSSMKSQDSPDLNHILDPTQHPPRMSSRSVSPASGFVVPPPIPAVVSAAPRVIRPSDIYRRMEEEKKEKERKLSLDSPGSRGNVPEVVANPSRRLSFGRDDSGDGKHSLQPLAPVAERKNADGLDELRIDSTGAPAQETNASDGLVSETTKQTETGPEPAISHLPPLILEHPHATDEAGYEAQEPTRRYSSSPKLPDLARMSVFGSDLFSGTANLLGRSSNQSGTPTEDAATRGVDNQTKNLAHDSSVGTQSQQRPFRPSLPGGWVSETASTPGGEIPTPLAVITENSLPIHEHPEVPSLKPAPLRTPTPRSSIIRPVDDDDGESIGSGHASPDIPPPLRTSASPSKLSLVERPAKTSEDGRDTAEKDEDTQAAEANPVAPAPLQPRKSPIPDSTTENLGHSVMRVDTMNTTESSSPLKESDFLRDEIIRSLSPVRSSDTHLDTSRDESAARESAYLSDVYGDYWTADAAPSEQKEHASQAENLETVGEKADSTSVTPTRPSHDWTSSVTSTNNGQVAMPASEPEADQTDMHRDRFSWEVGPRGNNTAVRSPTKHELPSIPQDIEDPVSAAAPVLSSPVDSGTLSPLISLPVLSFGGDDETTPKENRSRAVSAVSMLPPGHELEPPSPVSHNSGNDFGPRSPDDDRETKFLWPSDEKIVVTSPITPISPPAFGESHADRADSPEPTPTDIPLPRSPSPTRPAEDAQLSEKSMMSLHQIMQLPTSPERVYKMLETRAEFAAMESGLNQWLSQMLAQPEHAQGSQNFKYPPSGPDVGLLAVVVGRKRSSVGEGVQEYSSTGTGLTNVGSVRIAREANLQLGNLMHGTGQAGAKGKELLQSAGKMGKGLLSKGKNKLRERAESKRA